MMPVNFPVVPSRRLVGAQREVIDNTQDIMTITDITNATRLLEFLKIFFPFIINKIRKDRNKIAAADKTTQTLQVSESADKMRDNIPENKKGLFIEH